MNCAMSYRTLSFVLGLNSSSYVDEKIKLWVFEWGEAGKDISVLELTKDFLKKICPQAFKDEGLEKICAIPQRFQNVHTKEKYLVHSCMLVR
mmetsp:Transcript_15308/g.29134  ORF Transcript_15308/g.29134 Transcript_15308/m.29134 type:complete len:92 (-) Transcript_15308:390-665(-)